MKKLFVTGLTGFVGGAIKAAFRNENPYELELIGAFQDVELREPVLLNRAISQAMPDFVIHLAAQSFVPAAFVNPRETLEINLFGTLNLLQALKAADFSGRLLYISSGDVYGFVEPARLPVIEWQCVRPRNPYAVSKAAAEALCYQWSLTENFEVVIVRPFNHIGPGQDERFVVSGFCRQAVAIRHGKQTPLIEVGDLEVTRDFADVRDVVRAYLGLLINGGGSETYNVCSGRECLVSHVLQQILSIAGVNAEVRQDASRMRQAEQRRMFGSYAKLKHATGWEPAINLEQSLNDTLAHWETKYA